MADATRLRRETLVAAGRDVAPFQIGIRSLLGLVRGPWTRSRTRLRDRYRRCRRAVLAARGERVALGDVNERLHSGAATERGPEATVLDAPSPRVRNVRRRPAEASPHRRGLVEAASDRTATAETATVRRSTAWALNVRANAVCAGPPFRNFRARAARPIRHGLERGLLSEPGMLPYAVTKDRPMAIARQGRAIPPGTAPCERVCPGWVRHTETSGRRAYGRSRRLLESVPKLVRSGGSRRRRDRAFFFSACVLLSESGVRDGHALSPTAESYSSLVRGLCESSAGPDDAPDTALDQHSRSRHVTLLRTPTRRGAQLGLERPRPNFTSTLCELEFDLDEDDLRVTRVHDVVLDPGCGSTPGPSSSLSDLSGPRGGACPQSPETT